MKLSGQALVDAIHGRLVAVRKLRGRLSNKLRKARLAESIKRLESAVAQVRIPIDPDDWRYSSRTSVLYREPWD